MQTSSDFIQFKNVSFTYPTISGEVDQDGKPVIPKAVYNNFTANFPGGFTNLVGPNASGKSTFMLLASGRLNPQQGNINLFGVDTKAFFIKQEITTDNGKKIILDCANPNTEETKNELASFVYQNMEFETEEKVSVLLETVYNNGSHSKNSNDNLFSEILKIAELDKVMNHKLTALSKGEIQRVLFAFSILYGSRSIFMDEPFFAMEQKQKESALSYLKSYSKSKNVPVYISMHDLDLTKKFADNVLLFYPDRTIELGTPSEVLTNEALEKSYGVPAAMLRDAETYTRQTLEQNSKVNSK